MPGKETAGRIAPCPRCRGCKYGAGWRTGGMPVPGPCLGLAMTPLTPHVTIPWHRRVCHGGDQPVQHAAAHPEPTFDLIFPPCGHSGERWLRRLPSSTLVGSVGGFAPARDTRPGKNCRGECPWNASLFGWRARRCPPRPNRRVRRGGRAGRGVRHQVSRPPPQEGRRDGSQGHPRPRRARSRQPPQGSRAAAQGKGNSAESEGEKDLNEIRQELHERERKLDKRQDVLDQQVDQLRKQESMVETTGASWPSRSPTPASATRNWTSSSWTSEQAARPCQGCPATRPRTSFCRP